MEVTSASKGDDGTGSSKGFRATRKNFSLLDVWVEFLTFMLYVSMVSLLKYPVLCSCSHDIVEVPC